MSPTFSLEELLQQSAALHHHLCPRQVLGVRMGMLAARLLQLELPQAQDDKRVLAIVEADGCFADGVSVSANCWVGRRTLRVEDFGKTAATFVDTQTEQAWRIAPHQDGRTLAAAYAPEACNRREGMLLGYQRMTDAELLVAHPVTLRTPAAQLISRPGCRALCARCGEEIFNEREVYVEGELLCRACAGLSYCR